MTNKTFANFTPESCLLSEMKVKTPTGSRKLTKSEKDALIQMFAIKAQADEFDVLSLAPSGSFLEKVSQHFKKTDIPYAIPIMQTIMLAASYLTQNGAYLDIPGVSQILPTLWMIGLAGSGSSKTLASEEVDRIIALAATADVSRLATGCTDAQWIVELHGNNGAFWFQDEVGKTFNAILTQVNYRRIKDWCLAAYSHKPIANLLKSEAKKLIIERPYFTFHGLTVDETWRSDIDLTSMRDGFCQRFNYYVAAPRRDTDLYDHFLYFEGHEVEEAREQLAGIWDALCSQEGACGVYTLNDEVLPFLKAWWRSLRQSWGQSALPESFIRRIGFAVLRYLMVLHFLLGKSRRPIDVETAEIATRYAEYHFTSALQLVQQYDWNTASRIQVIAAARTRLAESGKTVTNREVSRVLSTQQRRQFSKGEVAEILAVLNQIEEVPGLFDSSSDAKQKSSALQGRRDEIRARLDLNERKRNERRLRELRRNASHGTPVCTEAELVDDADGNVVQFSPAMTGTD